MRNPILFLLLGTLFFACQKDYDPALEETNKVCRLTKVIQGVHNGAADDTTFTFNYDSKGLISKIISTSFDDTSEYIMHYDGQGRLIKIEGYSETEFAYNNKGLLSEMRYVRFAKPEKLVFEYGTDSVPLSAKEYMLTGGQWQEELEYRYTYQNGNVTNVDMLFGGASIRKHNFEYDNLIPNNFKTLSLFDMNYYGFGFPEKFCYFNKNMMKKANRQDDGYYFNYTIDSGNVIKSTISWLDQNQIDTGMVETRFFFYDCK